MGDTFTIPLTTIFNPPASCSTGFTYEAQLYNSISGGLLIQNALGSPIETACFPSGFENNGRVPSAQVYSPGWCPQGYTTPQVSQGGGTTIAICCSNSYSYYSTYSTIANFPESGSVLFAGCISTYLAGGYTTVSARSADSALSLTSVSGIITMWAQPITVEYQQSDTSLFVTSTSTPTSTSASPQSTASAQPSSTNGSAGAISTTPTGTSLPASTSAPAASSGLSTGAQAGIGVGVALVGLALIALGILFFARRRRRRNTPRATGGPGIADRVQEHWNPKDQPNMTQGYATEPGYKGVLHEAPDGTPTPELDGNWISRRNQDAGELPA